MVDFYKLLDKETYLRIRYEIDQIFPDAIIQITKGLFIDRPYERINFSVEFLCYRTDDPPYGFKEL